jgi:hypothetical protein
MSLLRIESLSCSPYPVTPHVLLDFRQRVDLWVTRFMTTEIDFIANVLNVE